MSLAHLIDPPTVKVPRGRVVRKLDRPAPRMVPRKGAPPIAAALPGTQALADAARRQERVALLQAQALARLARRQADQRERRLRLEAIATRQARERLGRGPGKVSENRRILEQVLGAGEMRWRELERAFDAERRARGLAVVSYGTLRELVRYLCLRGLVVARPRTPRKGYVYALPGSAP